MPADPRTFPPSKLLLVYEEVPPHILGKAANKKDLPGGEPGWKDRMTSGVTSSLYFYTDTVTGRRTTNRHSSSSGILLADEDSVDRELPLSSMQITISKSEGSPEDQTEMAPK